MDKDILEIFDTAVKIGLGALISGASAYFLSLSKYNKEKEKDKRDNTMNLIKEIALNIHGANHKLSEAAHPFWHQAVKKEPDKYAESIRQSINLLLESLSLISQAEAMTCLVNVKVLRDHLKTLGKSINEIYEITASVNLFANEEKINEINTKLENIDSIFEKCFDELGASYKNA